MRRWRGGNKEGEGDIGEREKEEWGEGQTGCRRGKKGEKDEIGAGGKEERTREKRNTQRRGKETKGEAEILERW